MCFPITIKVVVTWPVRELLSFGHFATMCRSSHSVKVGEKERPFSARFYKRKRLRISSIVAKKLYSVLYFLGEVTLVGYPAWSLGCKREP